MADIAVTRAVPVDPPIDHVFLTLSGHEAAALLAVSERIGGSPHTTPRAVFADLCNLLNRYSELRKQADEIGLRVNAEADRIYFR